MIESERQRADLALADAVRAALDDERIKLPARAEQHFIAALTEQLAVRGLRLTREAEQ